MNTLKVEVIKYYPKGDTTFSGDYYQMKLIVDKKTVLELEDYYHDKSDVVIESFLKGLAYNGTTIFRTNRNELLDWD